MDSSNEPLQRRTAKVATRILKSRIREFIYFTKHREVGEADTRWAPMLLVEQGFSKLALREWQQVLTLWGDLSNEGTLQKLAKILADAFPEAASEVLIIFDEADLHPMRKIIGEYQKSLNVKDFLP